MESVRVILLFYSVPFILSLLYLFGRRGREKHSPAVPPAKLPPGPRKLPLIGNLHQLGRSRLLHRTLWQLSVQHGGGGGGGLPLMHLQLGQVPAVVVSSAELAEAVLKTHDLEFCSRPFIRSVAKLSYDRCDVAFAPYGPHWRELRKICVVELFTARKISSFRSVREEEVGRAMESIAGGGEGAAGVNLSRLLTAVLGNITSRMAFGRSGGHDDPRNCVHRVLRETQVLFMKFFVADYFPAMGWVDRLRGVEARLQDVFLELDAFYQKLIDEHLDPTRQLRSSEDADGEDILDALLRLQREDKSLTDEHIKGVLMNIVVAGFGTSTAGVEWAMTELMRHPEVMERAQAEVRGHVGSKGRVEEGDLHRLDYLKCVLKESLRIHPPVPLLVTRETRRRVQLGEHDVPAGTVVHVNAWAIGRDPGSWERPDAFDPGRFESSGGGGDDARAVQGQDFRFIPFGEGRRICPAKNAAMVTMEIVLANLLYCFDWALPEGMSKEDVSLDEAPGVTVHRKTPLVLVATQYGVSKI